MKQTVGINKPSMFLTRGHGYLSKLLLTFSSGHLTFASLRTRMGRVSDAKYHVDMAKHILETSGISARFSWLSSYCAYRAGTVAMLQDRVEDAMYVNNDTENDRRPLIHFVVKRPNEL